HGNHADETSIRRESFDIYMPWCRRSFSSRCTFAIERYSSRDRRHMASHSDAGSGRSLGTARERGMGASNIVWPDQRSSVEPRAYHHTNLGRLYPMEESTRAATID